MGSGPPRVCSLLALAAALLAAGCAMHAASPGSSQPALDTAPAPPSAPASQPGAAAQPGPVQIAGMPPFPDESGTSPLPGSQAAPLPASPAVPAVRLTSDEQEYTVDGTAFTAQSAGSQSYEDTGTPGRFVLVPEEGSTGTSGTAAKLAWAMYEMPGLTGDRPVRLSADMSSAPAELGGWPPLLLTYYVGVADFTTFSWEWHGPYGDLRTVVLNAAGRLDRYVSASGTLYCVVLTDSYDIVPDPPGNPDGLCAAAVGSVTVTTSSDYLTNRPHYAAITDVKVGSSANRSPSRHASYLEPEQFVTLNWVHVPEFNEADLPNAAETYEVFRVGPGETEPLHVGSVAAPLTAFTDPLDRLVGVDEPSGGTIYRYMLRAQNSAGPARWSSTRIAVPILAPKGVTATVNQVSIDGTRVSWDSVDGAESYEVWRGLVPQGTDAQLVGSVPGADLSHIDTTGIPGRQYWYFARAVGIGDGDPDNGIEPEARSDLSLTSLGLRSVRLSVVCLTGGVSGSGSLADPFVLDPAGTYLFGAVDQDGSSLTSYVTWSVAPSGRASFAASPRNKLQNIQPGASSFGVSARFAYLSYIWTGTAFCQAL